MDSELEVLPHVEVEPHAIGKRPRFSTGLQCSATNRKGSKCRHPAVAGATVCIYHGGSAPQVRAAAMRRLLEMVDPALAQLARIVQKGEGDAIKLRAAEGILDRIGVAAESVIRLTGSIDLASEIRAARRKRELAEGKDDDDVIEVKPADGDPA